MNKHLWWVVLVIAGIIAYGVKYTYFSEQFRYAGTLETTKVIISSKVSSDITSFPVEEGDSVEQGQTLLTMSCDVYKVQSHQINSDYERAKKLLEKGHVSQAEFDMIERNKLDNDLRLEWCNVKAPLSGTIITKFQEMGEIVNPGVPLVSIADMKDIWAYFYVPHDMVYKLSIGQKISAVLPEEPNRVFHGKIIKINEEAEFTPKNVQTKEERTRLVYGIKVKFENEDLVLKSGMTLESTLED